ncbi:MAG: hypothetical protein OEY01_14510 [Desulfobulbaceae bacterium]|nr:hypothetical protein [Desulfobulbaceae bacterium]
MEIFLSRPTWVLSEFEEGLKIFILCLENMELIPRTLGASDYPSKSPLDEVIEIMSQCSGAIILGYPQITIEQGRLKNIEIKPSMSLSTEWNHIEAALAYSQSLPILVVHHNTVSRGIFDRGVMNAFVHKVDMEIPSWSMNKAFSGALKKWKENCISGNSNFPGRSPKTFDENICPNCSTASKLIYMSKLSGAFKDFGDWHCPKCEYMK